MRSRNGSRAAWGAALAIVWCSSAAAWAGLWYQEAKLTGSQVVGGNTLGQTASVDGTTAALGGPWAGGQAYVFEKGAGGWAEAKRLLPSGGGAQFGTAVAVSGDTIIVTARAEAGNAGLAYIYDRDQGGAGNWGVVKQIMASNSALNSYFGAFADLSGDNAIVGANVDDHDGKTDSGAAYIFNRDKNGANQWGEVAYLKPSGLTAGDQFGMAVSISGEWAIVGAGNDDALGSDAGAAYMFQYDGTNWVERQKLTAGDGAAGDAFGWGAAVSGDTALVGSWKDDAGATDAGSAYIFEFDGTNWVETKKLAAGISAGAGDGFGVRTALDGDYALVGALWDDDKGTDSGSAYLFHRNAGGADNWGLVAKLLSDDAGGWLGHAVSMSGTTAFIGASRVSYPGKSTAGAGYMFTVPEPTTVLLLGAGLVPLLRRRKKR